MRSGEQADWICLGRDSGARVHNDSSWAVVKVHLVCLASTSPRRARDMLHAKQQRPQLATIARVLLC